MLVEALKEEGEEFGGGRQDILSAEINKGGIKLLKKEIAGGGVGKLGLRNNQIGKMVFFNNGLGLVGGRGVNEKEVFV